MFLVLEIAIGLAFGILLLWVDHRWDWRAAMAASFVLSAVVIAVVTWTDLPIEAAGPVLVSASVPTIVQGALTALRGDTQRA